MGKLNKIIGRQFGKPEGFIGRICCKVMNVINKKMYKSVVNEISADADCNILDVGYGNGYLLKLLFKKFRCNIKGIEVSPDAENFARKRNKKGIKSGKTELIQADCCNMPFVSEEFNFVASVNTIYFWNDTQKGLSEIHRVLKNGGIFYNAVYTEKWLKKLPYTSTGFKFFDRDDYIRLGKRAGFMEVKIKEIKKGKNFLVEFIK